MQGWWRWDGSRSDLPVCELRVLDRKSRFEIGVLVFLICNLFLLLFHTCLFACVLLFLLVDLWLIRFQRLQDQLYEALSRCDGFQPLLNWHVWLFIYFTSIDLQIFLTTCVFLAFYSFWEDMSWPIALISDSKLLLCLGTFLF